MGVGEGGGRAVGRQNGWVRWLGGQVGLGQGLEPGSST